jgi:hypothetical protein
LEVMVCGLLWSRFANRRSPLSSSDESGSLLALASQEDYSVQYKYAYYESVFCIHIMYFLFVFVYV